VAGWIGIAQLGFIHLLGERTFPATVTPATRTDADWVWLPRTPALLEELPDRAVLAEVTVHGFSGALWKGRAGTTLAGLSSDGGVSRLGAGRVVGPTFAPSQWGEPAVPVAGSVYLASAGRPVSRAAQAAAVNSVRGSHIRLGGALSERAFLGPETLPDWPHSEVLAPSTVHLLVDGDGTVLSAQLLPPGSGLPAADAEAVRLAQQLQFELGRQGEETAGERLWGSVTFVWRTLAPVPPP
jgi:hypothetical protein